ncbi:uncharacterized protein K444DRAFT_620285 [Hyaloscypha bicolor E]|uniref:Uncharacterized protein n=1 Tax=Hyaloscypha bicolor E TaxID=1095630 RepID=A0A2J6SK43_9HELO|nr:uncharacterized protein K444DRAFT_620285 [Hyaloscypha bicolor E]PMD51125.1 hypothetical protein K444DRAFT_620285 [Hyaloscypha bicolor E]
MYGSFPAWYIELKINFTFRNVWYLVNPDAPEAPYLLSAEEDYNRILDRGRIGRESPIAWINNWYQALARAQTYRVTEVEEFLVIKDFLQVQLALVIEANALGEPIRTLERSDSQGHSYSCKETRAEKHPWKPVNCSILELPTDEQLEKKG